MVFYLFLSERYGSGVGSRWALMGLAVKLGISVSVVQLVEPETNSLNLRFDTDGSP